MRAIVLTVLLAVVLLFVISTLVCNIIALCTNVWLKSSSEDQADFMNIGLFTACFHEYFHPHESPPKKYDGCHGLTSDTYSTIQDWLVPSWLTACKVVAVIALILQIIGTIFLILLMLNWFCKWACCDKNGRGCCERCLIYSTPILFVVAGMFMMSAVMIFADNAFRLQCRDFWLGGADPFTNHLSFSWAFAVAGCILSFLAGGFLIWLVAVKAREDDWMCHSNILFIR